MLIRIVKMTFVPEKLAEFKAFFDQYKSQINQFPGCHGVQLLSFNNQSNILFTYSHWDNESSLTNYKNSELFAFIWPQTKKFFLEKPEAWSCSQLYDGFEQDK